MLIAAAAVYGGVSYTALKREQLNELEALCHMLRLMQDELETRALPLPELAAQLEERTESAGKALLSGLLRRLPEERLCGIVRNIGRDGQSRRILTLAELREAEVDMFCTVFIGNSAAKTVAGQLITPRGYRNV